MARIDTRIVGLDGFLNTLARYVPGVEQRTRKALKKTCVQWSREAKRRVPVDTGLTRNTILYEVGEDSRGLFGAVGSNQKHAPYIEFGTWWIAGGRVMALGADPEITDAQAVRNWPAKNFGTAYTTKSGKRSRRGARIDLKTGKELGAARRARLKREVAGSPDEQMPWLRSSFMSIREKAIQWLLDALRF